VPQPSKSGTSSQAAFIRPPREGLEELRVAYQVESDLESISSEWNKQYSVAYYARLKYGLGASDQTLKDAIDSNNLRWAGEHVFGLNYHEYSLRLKDNVLFSPDFGNRSLLDMCRDAVLIREKAGVDLVRSENEQVGIEKLQELLNKMQSGQTAILISPPDPNDSGMAGHSMIYVYEKQNGESIRATAIRDNVSNLEDLRVLAGSLCGAMPVWQKADHLKFVATPFVTNSTFEELVMIVGVSEKNKLPSWVNDLSRTVTQAMLYELSQNDMSKVKRIFDAFQMAVKTRYENQTWIDPIKMIENEELWMRAQQMFLEVGGMEMIRAGGSCGRGDIGLRDNNVMSELLGVNEKSEETYSFDHEGQCVVCKVDPKKLGPCGICEQCDHKIRQQAG